jgi:uncharacterized protein YuzE
MITQYDPEADVLYIQFAPEDSASEGEEVHPGVMLMFNGNNRVVAIEIQPASKVLPEGAIAGLPLPVAAE